MVDLRTRIRKTRLERTVPLKSATITLITAAIAEEIIVKPSQMLNDNVSGGVLWSRRMKHYAALKSSE